MPVFTLKERNNIILIILLALGLFLFYASIDIIGAILGVIVFYTIFRPLHKYLVEKKKWRSGYSSIFIIIISFFIIVLPFLFTITMVVDKIQTFSENIPYIKQLLSNINNFAASKLKQPHLINDLFLRAQSMAVGVFSNIVGGVGSVLLDVSIMYFLLYFMLADYKAFEQALLKYSPLSTSNSILFGKEIERMTYANILGQGFISFVQGALLAVGFYIFGVPDAIFWGTITIFLSFLPVVGTPIIFVPAAIIQLSNNNLVAGIGLLLWGFIIVSNADNVLRFFISKKIANIHPIISIVGVIIGIPVFGILGLVYGPLLISSFITLINIYSTNHEKIKDETSFQK